MLGYDEGIKLGLFDGKVLVTILGNIDVFIHGLDVGTYLSSLDGYLDGFKYNKLEGLWFTDSLVPTDSKVPGSDEGIKLVSKDGKVLGNILVNVDVITIGLDVGTELGYFR